MGILPRSAVSQLEALPTHAGISKRSSPAWSLKGKALLPLTRLPARWSSVVSSVKEYCLNIILSLCGTESSSQGLSWYFQMAFLPHHMTGDAFYCFLRLYHFIFNLPLIYSLCDHTLGELSVQRNKRTESFWRSTWRSHGVS